MKVKWFGAFFLILLLMMVISVSGNTHSAEGNNEEVAVEYIPEVYVDPIEDGDEVDTDFDVDASLADVQEMIESSEGKGWVNFNLETNEVTIEERVSQETQTEPVSSDGVTSEVHPNTPEDE